MHRVGHCRHVARQGHAGEEVRPRRSAVPAHLDLSPDHHRAVCRPRRHARPVGRIGPRAHAGLHGCHRGALVGRCDTASRARRGRSAWRSGPGRATQRAAAHRRRIRHGRLATGGGARAGVLPDQAEHRPGLPDRTTDRSQRAPGHCPPGLQHDRSGRVRPGHRRHLRLCRSPGLRDRHHHPGRRCRTDRDQPAARRPGEARRSGVLLQALDSRGGAEEWLFRHLHGQADAGPAGQCHAHSPERGVDRDRPQRLQFR